MKEKIAEVALPFELRVEKALSLLEGMGKKPNFIFSGDSVLHVAALNAFLKKKASEGVPMCGVVCNTVYDGRDPQYGPDAIIAVDSCDFIYLEIEGAYDALPATFLTKARRKIFLNSLYYRASKVLNSCANSNGYDCFYYIHPAAVVFEERYFNVALLMGRPLFRVILEEGIGTYASRKLPKQGKGVFRGKNDKAARFEEKRERVLRKIALEERFCLFHASEGELMKNYDFIEWMTKSFADMARLKGVDGFDYSNTVIIVGTFIFSDLGGLEAELGVLSRVVIQLKECGVRVVYRPHPRAKNIDKYRSLGVEIDLSQKVPFEAVLAASSHLPLAMMGFCSSSELMSNAFWDIPCFSLCQLLRKEVLSRKGDSTKIIEEINRIEGIESGLADYVSSFDSLSAVKSSIQSLISR